MNQSFFVIIGAMKCGTSTLAAQLSAQDGLFLTTPKEPNFFSDDDVFAKGRDWYVSLFDAANQNDICGEASTHYTKRPDLPKTVERLAEFRSDVRLVYMIRNPLDRLVSHYIHDWSEARISTSLNEAISSYAPLLDYGLFGWQVAPFVEKFGRDAILLTSLERLKADPEVELSRVAHHVGHQGDVFWNEDSARENVSSARIRKFPLYGPLVTSPIATRLRRMLVPSGLRRRIREARQLQDRPTLSEEIRKELQDRFLQDREILNGFFPNDPSVKLAYPFAS